MIYHVDKCALILFYMLIFLNVSHKANKSKYNFIGYFEKYIYIIRLYKYLRFLNNIFIRLPYFL